MPLTWIKTLQILLAIIIIGTALRLYDLGRHFRRSSLRSSLVPDETPGDRPHRGVSVRAVRKRHHFRPDASDVCDVLPALSRGGYIRVSRFGAGIRRADILVQEALGCGRHTLLFRSHSGRFIRTLASDAPADGDAYFFARRLFHHQGLPGVSARR